MFRFTPSLKMQLNHSLLPTDTILSAEIDEKLKIEFCHALNYPDPFTLKYIIHRQAKKCAKSLTLDTSKMCVFKTRSLVAILWAFLRYTVMLFHFHIGFERISWSSSDQNCPYVFFCFYAKQIGSYCSFVWSLASKINCYLFILFWMSLLLMGYVLFDDKL